MNPLLAALNWKLSGNLFMPWPRLPLCLFTFFGFLVLSFCSKASAQEPNVDEVAKHIAQQITKAEKKRFSPKILVIDFSSQPGGIQALGKYLADQLSDDLSQIVPPMSSTEKTSTRISKLAESPRLIWQTLRARLGLRVR
jgi:hypothetical protein